MYGGRPPRSPSRSASLICVGHTQPIERVPHSQVTGEEHIGMAETAHRHVVGRPGTDPADCDQVGAGTFRIRTGIEVEITGGDNRTDVSDRVSSRRRHRQGAVTHPCELRCAREQPLQIIVIVEAGRRPATRTGIANCRHESCRDRARPRH
jgi:hypothetical protein